MTPNSESARIMALRLRLRKRNLMMMMMLSAQINDVSGGLNSRVLSSRQLCQVVEEIGNCSCRGENVGMAFAPGPPANAIFIRAANLSCHHQSLSALSLPLDRLGLFFGAWAVLTVLTVACALSLSFTL